MSGMAWSVYGQTDMGSINNAENFRFNVKSLKNIKSFEDISQYFDGSVLLLDDWGEGVITMSSEKEEHRLMNYFLLDNSLVYKDDKDSILTFVYSDRIKNVLIGGRKFEMITYMDKKGENVETGVMEIMVEGNPLALAKKYDAVIKEGQDGSGYKEATRPYIETKAQLFYKPGDGIFTPVPSRKKDYYSIFGDKAKEVEAHAKQNKLKINDMGIAAMCEYYNSLF